MSEMVMSLLEGGARVADGDGHEFHLSPKYLEGGNEWGVRGGLLLEPLLTSDIRANLGPLAILAFTLVVYAAQFSPFLSVKNLPYNSTDRAP